MGEKKNITLSPDKWRCPGCQGGKVLPEAGQAPETREMWFSLSPDKVTLDFPA